jgi:hypothetical protein
MGIGDAVHRDRFLRRQYAKTSRYEVGGESVYHACLSRRLQYRDQALYVSSYRDVIFLPAHRQTMSAATPNSHVIFT